MIGNDAFQEVDIIGVTRNIAKFVIMVRDREMLAQRIKEAFYIARSGKPGPVLVDLPTDVMAAVSYTHLMIKGSYENMKITTPEDMLLGEAILKGRSTER